MIGSVHAVAETGCVIIRFKDRQPAAAAAHVIWVVGTQKIVPTLEDSVKCV
jgi:L-lactate utilization protein LutC